MAASRLSIFNLFARIYDFLTDQDFWRAQIRRTLDHVDTSGGGRSDPKAFRVLDLGCGPGVSSFALAECLGPEGVVIGIDNAEKMVHRARRHHQAAFPELTGVSFEHADAQQLPFPDGAFDLAIGHSFLYLVPEKARVLREARRVLAPGASLVLMEPRAGVSLLGASLRSMKHAGALARSPGGTLRFLVSMVAWRIVALASGRLSPELVEPMVLAAGFDRVACVPTLGGLGLHIVARVDDPD